MTDSRDQPELETLSYEPTSAPPEVKGKNTLVIKPETPVNSSEVVGQPLEQSKGDELNKLESEAIAKYKAIMGEMTDLEAMVGLKRLFEESLPMCELMESLGSEEDMMLLNE